MVESDFFISLTNHFRFPPLPYTHTAVVGCIFSIENGTIIHHIYIYMIWKFIIKIDWTDLLPLHQHWVLRHWIEILWLAGTFHIKIHCSVDDSPHEAAQLEEDASLSAAYSASAVRASRGAEVGVLLLESVQKKVRLSSLISRHVFANGSECPVLASYQMWFCHKLLKNTKTLK